MARSFSSAKIFTSLVVDGFSNVISRRGYSAASQGVVSSVARAGATAGSRKTTKKSVEENTEKVSWIPDPVTGYYRPDNGVPEIDVAELRATLLKKH